MGFECWVFCLMLFVFARLWFSCFVVNLLLQIVDCLVVLLLFIDCLLFEVSLGLCVFIVVWCFVVWLFVCLFVMFWVCRLVGLC